MTMDLLIYALIALAFLTLVSGILMSIYFGALLGGAVVRCLLPSSR